MKIIASTGVASVVTELGQKFEAKTGHKVQTDFAVIAVSKRKIDAGAAFAIAVLGPAAIDELIEQDKIVRDTRTGFGRTGLGVAARKGGPSLTSVLSKPSSARCWRRSQFVIRRKVSVVSIFLPSSIASELRRK
jgi:ABC-type molybdate transport system substrate-binding protein